MSAGEVCEYSILNYLVVQIIMIVLVDILVPLANAISEGTDESKW